MRTVNVRELFGLLLAVLVAAGLTIAPLATPAAAAHSMTDKTTQMADMSDVTAGMPCCPSKAPAPVDCDKCVFMAACMSQLLAGPPAATFRPPFAVSGSIAPLQNDFWPDGVGRPPPEHPPRTLV